MKLRSRTSRQKLLLASSPRGKGAETGCVQGEISQKAKQTMRVRLHGEEGETIIEVAMSCMALLVLFFGVMEMSLAFYTYHFLSEASRQATRFAIVRGSACTGLATCNASSTDIENYVKGLDFPGIVRGNLTVTTTWPTTGAACTPSSLPCNNPGNRVKVKVQYAFPLTIPSIKSTTLTLSSTSQMVISQ